MFIFTSTSPSVSSVRRHVTHNYYELLGNSLLWIVIIKINAVNNKIPNFVHDAFNYHYITLQIYLISKVDNFQNLKNNTRFFIVLEYITKAPNGPCLFWICSNNCSVMCQFLVWGFWPLWRGEYKCNSLNSGITAWIWFLPAPLACCVSFSLYICCTVVKCFYVNTVYVLICAKDGIDFVAIITLSILYLSVRFWNFNSRWNT